MREIEYHLMVLYPGIDDIPEYDRRLRICLARRSHYPDRWEIVDLILPDQQFGGNSGVGPGDQWKGHYREEDRAMVVVSDKHPAHATFRFLAGAVMMGIIDERRVRQMVEGILEAGKEIGSKILADTTVLGADARAEAHRSTR